MCAAITLRSCLAVAVAAAGLLAACGGEEESFSPEEFVETMRENGVEMALGKPLFSADESKEVVAVELEPLPGTPTPEEGALEDPHGSLTAHDDVAGADDQFRNCEATADLLCFQAANVVIVLEGGGLEADRLAAAMKKLETD